MRVFQSVVMNTEKPKMIRKGNSRAVLNVLNEVVDGTVKGLISVGVDPVYSFPNNVAFTEAYSRLELSASFSFKKDATASLSQLVAATPHYLESWGDTQLKKRNIRLNSTNHKTFISIRDSSKKVY